MFLKRRERESAARGRQLREVRKRPLIVRDLGAMAKRPGLGSRVNSTDRDGDDSLAGI